MIVKNEISSALSILYPYGATLAVQKPAVPIISTVCIYII
jgi:hypothetical protein